MTVTARPRPISMSPSSRSSRSARRTVLRLTPRTAARSQAWGMRCPDSASPSAIARRIAAATCSCSRVGSLRSSRNPARSASTDGGALSLTPLIRLTIVVSMVLIDGAARRPPRSLRWGALAGLFEDAWARERRRRRWLLALVLLATAAVLVATLDDGGHRSSANPGINAGARSSLLPHCGHISNLYAASLAQLHACGLTEIPLSSVTALPGGGKSYHYRQPDGQIASVIQAPRGFNGLTASRAEDRAYGVPSAPPRHSAGYVRWKQLVGGHYAAVTEHAYLVIGEHPMDQALTQSPVLRGHR